MRVPSTRSSGERGTRLAGLVLAAAIFVGGLTWAIQSSPVGQVEPNVGALLILLAAPSIILLGAAEFLLLSRYHGLRLSGVEAFSSTVYATAANLLPLPGGLLVRMAVLKRHGVAYRSSLLLMLLSFAAWASLAFLYAGLWLSGWVSMSFLGIGLAGSIAASSIAWRIKPDAWHLVGLLAIRALGIPLAALRMLLAFWALGLSVNFAQASVFVVSSVVGSAVAFAPAGLGISEAASAAVSPLVGIEAASGFLAGAVLRIAVMAGTGVMALYLLASSKSSA